MASLKRRRMKRRRWKHARFVRKLNEKYFPYPIEQFYTAFAFAHGVHKANDETFSLVGYMDYLNAFKMMADEFYPLRDNILMPEYKYYHNLIDPWFDNLRLSSFAAWAVSKNIKPVPWLPVMRQL